MLAKNTVFCVKFPRIRCKNGGLTKNLRRVEEFEDFFSKLYEESKDTSKVEIREFLKFFTPPKINGGTC